MGGGGAGRVDIGRPAGRGERERERGKSTGEKKRCLACLPHQQVLLLAVVAAQVAAAGLGACALCFFSHRLKPHAVSHAGGQLPHAHARTAQGEGGQLVEIFFRKNILLY